MLNYQFFLFKEKLIFKLMEQLKNIGDDFFNENMFEEAIEKYTLALHFDSDDKYKIYLNRCLSFYKLKKYNKALSDAIKATRLKPDNAKTWGRLGSCLSILGKKYQAVYAFKKAYELEPLNENYKIESNREIDFNDSDTEEEDDNKYKKEEDDDTEDEDNKDKEEEDGVKKEEEKDDEEKHDEEKDDKEKHDEEKHDEEKHDEEKDDKEKDDKEKEENINTINCIPNIDSMLNNKMVNNMFNKMLSNEELLKKISEQSFQDKMLSYQSNPFEVLKDKEIMTLMSSFFAENKN
jgi:tetratricopeptide (TPR) repeat protein